MIIIQDPSIYFPHEYYVIIRIYLENNKDIHTNWKKWNNIFYY